MLPAKALIRFIFHGHYLFFYIYCRRLFFLLSIGQSFNGRLVWWFLRAMQWWFKWEKNVRFGGGAWWIIGRWGVWRWVVRGERWIGVFGNWFWIGVGGIWRLELNGWYDSRLWDWTSAQQIWFLLLDHWENHYCNNLNLNFLPAFEASTLQTALDIRKRAILLKSPTRFSCPASWNRVWISTSNSSHLINWFSSGYPGTIYPVCHQNTWMPCSPSFHRSSGKLHNTFCIFHSQALGLAPSNLRNCNSGGLLKVP